MKGTPKSSLAALINYFFGLKSRVSDVSVSIDFIIWRQNLSLLSLQSLLLNGTLYHEYRFSFIIFSSIWVGRGFHHAQYLKKFGPRGILSHLPRPVSFLKMNFVLSSMLLASFTWLLATSNDRINLSCTVLLPCLLSVVTDGVRDHPRYETAVAFFRALESAYFVSVASLLLDRNPYLIYDTSSTHAVIATAFFNNILGFLARYFMDHYTVHQIHAQELYGWKVAHSEDPSLAAWEHGKQYKQQSLVRHKGNAWEACGNIPNNQAEPGSLWHQVYIMAWLKPFRILPLLMMLQMCHVIVAVIYSLCSDSWVILGAMAFINADFLQLLHSIRFAILGKTVRNVMLTKSTTEALPATLQTVMDPNAIANQTIRRTGLPKL